MNNNYNNFRGNLVEATKDRWHEILALFAPELGEALEKYQTSKPHVSCPVHGGKDGFRLFKDTNETGGGICNSCGQFGSGFKLLTWLDKARETENNIPSDYNPSSDTERIKKIRKMIGHYIEHGSVKYPELSARILQKIKNIPKETEEEKQRKAEYVMKIAETMWKESISYDENIYSYFHGRGLNDFEISPIMKYNPTVPYYTDAGVEYYPAMITPITLMNDDGSLKVVGLHRVYLFKNDKGLIVKAPVDSPKKILKWGEINGAAIRVYGSDEPQDTIVVTEGVETAAAVRKLSNLPVWSCITAIGMENLILPKNVSRLIIAEDYDVKNNSKFEAGKNRGQKAALRLKEKAEALGIEVIIISPSSMYTEGDKGIDWDDAYKKNPELSNKLWEPYKRIATPNFSA